MRGHKVPTIPVGYPNHQLPVSAKDVEEYEYGIARLEIYQRMKVVCP
jgi:hypothetical protein